MEAAARRKLRKNAEKHLVEDRAIHSHGPRPVASGEGAGRDPLAWQERGLRKDGLFHWVRDAGSAEMRVPVSFCKDTLAHRSRAEC